MARYLWAFMAMIVLGCAATDDRRDGSRWNHSMREFSEVLSSLLSRAMTVSAVSTSTEKGEVIADLDRLASLSHTVDSSTVVPSMDKSLRVVSKEFKAEVKDISRLAAMERWPEARRRTLQLTRYCISCHTLTAGSSSPYTVDFKAPRANFNNFQKAQYYAAIRKFEEAINHFEYALTDVEWAAANPNDWDKAAMMLLAVVTHVKSDPDLALEMISRFFDTKAYPDRLRTAAFVWRKHAKEWRDGKNSAANFSLIEQWVNSSKTFKQPHADVLLLLRASSKLHEMLSFSVLSKKDEQKALLLAAEVGTRLGDLNFLYFPEQYLDACVKIDPKSAAGLRCRAQRDQLSKG